MFVLTVFLRKAADLAALVESVEGVNKTLVKEQEQLREENARMQRQISGILAALEDFNLELSDCCNYSSGSPDPGHGFGDAPGNGPGTSLPPGGLPGPGFNAGGPARLEQNAPNPFSEHTWIRYHLPEGTTNARIVLTDLGGNRVMSYDLPGDGAGQLMISGGALRSGTYIYTLVVNREVADSKRLVLLQ